MGRRRGWQRQRGRGRRALQRNVKERRQNEAHQRTRDAADEVDEIAQIRNEHRQRIDERDNQEANAGLRRHERGVFFEVVHWENQ